MENEFDNDVEKEVQLRVEHIFDELTTTIKNHKKFAYASVLEKPNNKSLVTFEVLDNVEKIINKESRMKLPIRTSSLSEDKYREERDSAVDEILEMIGRHQPPSVVKPYTGRVVSIVERLLNT